MQGMGKAARHKATPRRGRRWLFIILMAVFVTVGAVAAYNLIALQAQYQQAQSQYSGLRQSYAPRPTTVTTPDPGATDDPPARVIDHAALAKVNPHYIGWLEVPGTVIDYPVVQTEDNVRYLTYTFDSTINPSGTIFADYRCPGGFEASLCILHGHNMKDGSMFASLNQYLDKAFETQHPAVYATTPDGKTSLYVIFAVRLTSIFDPLYGLLGQGQEAIDKFLADQGAAPGARVLALSTCTNSSNHDERLIVYAVNY